MKKPVVDITLIESYNIYSIGFGDTTSYDESWTVASPSFEITPPGFPKINVTFTPKSTNYFKSSMLGITCDEDQECVPLPDGLYTVKYSIHPNAIYFVEKTFMRVNQIKCEVGNAFLKVDLESDCHKGQRNQDKKQLQLINMLVEGSVAAANACDTDRAYKFYNKAKQLLNNFHKSGCDCK